MKFEQRQNWIKIILFVLAIAVLVAGVWLFLPKILAAAGYLVRLFLPFLLGYLLSVAVNPLADMLQKKLKIPRGLSAVMVIILTIGIIGGLLTAAIWKIIDEVRSLYMQFPEIYRNMKITAQQLTERLSNVYASLPANVQQAISGIGDSISQGTADFINSHSTPVVGYASQFAKALPSVFVAVIVFILSTYFMVADSKGVSRTVAGIFPKRLRARLRIVKEQLKIYLGGYIKAQGIIMVIVFAVMFIELSILGVNYALLIAIGVAVLDALPFFGSGLVLWPWAVISFINGNFKLGIGLVIVYISIALIRRFTEPKLVSSSVGLNPILTLMSMYVGYKVLSIGGLILGPIIMLLIIAFYKAGLFDGIIHAAKYFGAFVRQQYELFKEFIKRITGSE